MAKSALILCKHPYTVNMYVVGIGNIKMAMVVMQMACSVDRFYVFVPVVPTTHYIKKTS